MIWGQRVTVCNELSPAFGRVGRYEGILSEMDLCRVSFPQGVIYVEPWQLLASGEHPVLIARRLKKAGLRPPRPVRRMPPPPCYVKDYGKTSLELAVDAFVDGTGSAHEMMRLQWDEFKRRNGPKPRRLAYRRSSSARLAGDFARILQIHAERMAPLPSDGKLTDPSVG